MVVRHYALINLGRDKDEHRSTQHIDLAALELLLELVGDEQAAIFGVEFNEGDDNNELALARRVFKGWTMYAGPPGRRVREPILLSPDQPPARWQVRWVPGTAVPRWSPQRSVLRVALADEPETLITCHNAAGPHTDGSRPKEVRAELATSWDLSNAARLQTKRASHRAGRHVTEMSDLNHYRLRPLSGELEVLHERTDYGYAWAAKGHDARFRQGRSGHIGLDSHAIRTMHGSYPKETR